MASTNCSLFDAASRTADECRKAFEECRIFVTDVNRIIEHAREEPLNTTWYGVYNEKVQKVARSIDAADETARKLKHRVR